MVSTFAGSTEGFADGIGTEAQFNLPFGVAVDSEGNVYVADLDNHRIRKITPAGVVSTLAGTGTEGFADGTTTTAQFNGPTGVAVDSSGNVFVADSDNHRIRKIESTGCPRQRRDNGAPYVNVVSFRTAPNEGRSGLSL